MPSLNISEGYPSQSYYNARANENEMPVKSHVLSIDGDSDAFTPEDQEYDLKHICPSTSEILAAATSSQEKHYQHSISSSTSHASRTSHIVRTFSALREAVKDDDFITVQKTNSSAELIPDSALSLIQREISRRSSVGRRYGGSSLHSEKFNEAVEEPMGSSSDFEADGPPEVPKSNETIFPEDLGIPDGGYAWVIATCACVLTMATWGSNASYGVFLNYYLSSNYFPGATDFDYALIGGLVAAIALSLSPVVFVFVSYLGLKQTISLGIIIQTAGYILASFATKTWQLYMTQGVLVGVSFSLVFVSSISILPNWFFYKRALASGIMVSGAGTGGILFSLSSNKLMEQTGNHKWPLRMVGFVTLFMCVVCMLLLKQYPKTSPNHPKHPAHIPQPRPSLKKAFEVVFDFSIVELIPIHFITVWYMLCNVGYIILLFSMSAYSSSVGLTHQQGSNITAILNVGQCIGRPLMGYAADRVGRINFTIVVTFTVSLLIFTFWINAKTYAALCVFALVTGSIIGIGSVNNQPLALEVSGSARFPSAFSYMNIIVGITTMFAEVMALKLRNNNLSNPFLHCQIFTGVLYFGAFLIISPVREWKVKRLFSKRRDEIFGLLDRNGLIDGETVLTREEVELYKKRLHKYDILLSTEVSGYITRLVYPIKV